MKYIENRLEMNAFIDKALKANQLITEFRDEDGMLCQLLNKATQETFEIKWAIGETLTEFTKRISETESKVLEPLYNMIEADELDTVIVIMGKWVVKSDYTRVFSYSFSTAGPVDIIQDKTIKEIYDSFKNKA